MKYIITGSLGHISRPVTKALINAGHEVVVISSQPERAESIRALGAIPAIGSLTDEDFVLNTFKNADAVYLMIPPNFAVTDFPAYQSAVRHSYMNALQQSNIKHIVLLSSMGAHLREGAGPIDELGKFEEQLQSLQGKDITVLRPSFFYYNFLGMAGMLKAAGIIGSNFGGDNKKIALVHHLDIADRAIHHLLHPSAGISIEYIASDELTGAEIAGVLGKTVGKNDTQWISFSDEDSYTAMIQQGLNASLASEYIEMGKSFREGKVQEDYLRQHVTITGKRNLESFAGEFAKVYNAIPEQKITEH